MRSWQCYLEYLNSNMVRLKPKNKSNVMPANVFQFQHGTIKAKGLKYIPESSSLISIPTWYD